MNTNTDHVILDKEFPKYDKKVNKGNLLMYSYVPSNLPKHAPLVVVLHGCLEGSGDAGIARYANDTGWVEYAKKCKLAVLLPDQQPENKLLSEVLVHPGEGGITKWITEIVDDPKTRHRLTTELEGMREAMRKASDHVSKGVMDQMLAWLEAPYKPLSKTLSALFSALYVEGRGLSSLIKKISELGMEDLSEVDPFNPMRCFQFYDPLTRTDTASSIMNMIQKMVDDHGIDEQKIYITGLSAGAAMTAVMLSFCPETFAGGAIVAGLPYGCADNAVEAIECMNNGKNRTPQEWGDRVREKAPREWGDAKKAVDKKWPRVSIWHGGVDQYVNRINANELVKQWTNVHKIGTDDANEHHGGLLGEEIVQGVAVHRKYGLKGKDKDTVLVESFIINDMKHGIAVDPLKGCGNWYGRFISDYNLCSTKHICEFWGLDARNTA